MSHRTVPAALFIAALAAAPASAQPGGTITAPFPQPLASYNLTGSPTSETDRSHPGANLTAAIPPSGLNELPYNWLFYRMAGDAVQRPFGNYTKSDGFPLTGTSSWPMSGNGHTASYTWTDYGPAGPRFVANYTLSISAGPTDYDTKLSQSLQITNPGTSPLTISLFETPGPYPGGSGGLYSAFGGLNSMSVTGNGQEVTFSATGATAYEALTSTALTNLLYGGRAVDLNDTGLPISNYNTNQSGILIELAVEWTATIPPGSMTFNSTITTGLPEPSTFALATAAAVGLAAARRLRRRLGGSARAKS